MAPPKEPERPRITEEREIEFEEIEQSFLRKLFGEIPFTMEEKDLEGAEKEVGATLKPDGELVFDTKAIAEQHAKLVDQFIGLVDQQKWKDSKFAWYFEEEGEEFAQSLATSLRERKKKTPEEKLSLRSLHQDMQERIGSAAESLQDMAKREIIKAAIREQVKRIPLGRIIGKNKRTNEEANLNFNPHDLSDPRNDVEFLFASGSDGQPELLMNCSNPDLEIVGLTIRGDKETWQREKKFGIAKGRKLIDREATRGENFSCFEIEIIQGGAESPPIFRRVRILMEPINLEEKVRELEEEREARKKQATAYQPPPPATPTPTTPRWGQRTTYVSVSH